MYLQVKAQSRTRLVEGVLKPDIYDPALNPLYRDMPAYYGAVAMPFLIRDPDRLACTQSPAVAERFVSV